MRRQTLHPKSYKKLKFILMKKIRYLLGIMLLIPGALWADTLYVDCNLSSDCETYNPGTRSCNGGTYKGYKNLQAALNNVQIGDVILGREGRYSPEAPTYRYTIPTAKNGTSWNEGEYFTLKSADGEWMILDGQNNLPSGSVYAVLGRTNPILQYWKFERIEICNGGSADGSLARGFHADGGPFIFRYCYIHDNYSANVGTIPAGLSGHGWDSCLVEYCHFKDNGSLTTMHRNASHICMYSDYNEENILQSGFTYLKQGEHTTKNIFRYNLFEGGSWGMLETKGAQMFCGRDVNGNGYSDQYKEYGDKVHHNIFRNMNTALELHQDFIQVYNNIIDRCVDGIRMSNEDRIKYKQCVYNNTIRGISKTGIKGIQYHFFSRSPDTTFVWEPMYYGYVLNNIIDSCSYASNSQEELALSVAAEWTGAMQDSFKINHCYSYRPGSHSNDPDGSRIIYWKGTRYTINQFKTLRPDVELWMNAYNPGDYLYKGTTGSARFKTRGNHVLSGSTTIANGGIGGAHPYLNSITLPSYIGATDPSDDSWVNTVLSLVNLGVITGINGVLDKEKLSVKLFPNPAGTTLSVSLEQGVGRQGKIELYSLEGARIYQSSQEVSFPHHVDVSAYAPGVYFVKVSSSDKYFTQKVIIN